MASIESITHTLFVGLYDYVANRNKKSYREEFAKRKTFNTKFALDFFPKYIDFEKWSKNPRDPYDMLLINYWMIEVPVVGLRYTNLYGSYLNGNRILNRRLKKKTDSPMKIRNKKKKSGNIKPMSQYELELTIINKKMIEIEESLMMQIKLEQELKKQKLEEREIKKPNKVKKVKKPKKDFDNSQTLLHFSEINDEIQLKLSKSNIPKSNFNILYKNHTILIDVNMFEFALTYLELEKRYRLEAKTLIEILFSRIGDTHPRYTENDIILFFNEIINQKKIIDEKNKWKDRVVWTKKDNNKTHLKN